MNIAKYRLMGLASRPQLPPLDVKIETIIIIMHASCYNFRRLYLGNGDPKA